MGDHTAIEWTDATWNPLRGCSRVSEGCRHCYAERVAARFSGAGQPYEGLIHPKTRGWNGKVCLVPEALDQPLRWKRPRRIFVNSMSDLFHESVPDDFIDRVFAVMALAPQHTFQVLTKRPERMRAYLTAPDTVARVLALLAAAVDGVDGASVNVYGVDDGMPGLLVPNVWLGVSVEDQAAADERIPLLLQCPAAVRWISAEPLLGPVDLTHIQWPEKHKVDVLRRGAWDLPGWLAGFTNHSDMAGIDWVVAGGESGHGARPMHPDWARSLRDQCAAAGVSFLFKQWGDWEPRYYTDAVTGARLVKMSSTKNETVLGDPLKPSTHVNMARVGKKAAGRHLDGVLHDGFPEVRT